MSDMSFVLGHCPHGILVAAAVSTADEDTLRDMASAYTLSLADSATFNGSCAECQIRYKANCELIGIEQ